MHVKCEFAQIFLPLWYLYIFRWISQLLTKLRNIKSAAKNIMRKTTSLLICFSFWKHKLWSTAFTISDDSYYAYRSLFIENIQLTCHFKVWDCLPKNLRICVFSTMENCVIQRHRRDATLRTDGVSIATSDASYKITSSKCPWHSPSSMLKVPTV